MRKIRQIEVQVSKLSSQELVDFRAWYSTFDADAWDHPVEQDAASGKLGQLPRGHSRHMPRVEPRFFKALRRASRHQLFNVEIHRPHKHRLRFCHEPHLRRQPMRTTLHAPDARHAAGACQQTAVKKPIHLTHTLPGIADLELVFLIAVGHAWIERQGFTGQRREITPGKKCNQLRQLFRATDCQIRTERHIL